MNCRVCGSVIPDSSKFCTKCGAVQGISTPDAPPYSPNNTYPPNAPYTPASSQKSGSSPLLITLVIVLGVALIAALFILFLPMLNGLNSPKDAGTLNIDPNSQNISGDSAVLSPGNPYEDCFLAHEDFVLPGSDSSFKCYDDLKDFTPEEVEIAVQEIYARQGYSFTDSHIQEYFDHRTWYKQGGSFQANTYEQANLDLLTVYQAIQNSSWESSGNRYIHVFQNTGEYANPHSNTRYLTANELKDLTAIQLELMRNEIFARRGAIFSDEDLRMYFYSKPWFKATIPYSEFDITLNEYELSNANLILIYEKKERGVKLSADNPYREYYDYYRDYVISYSDTSILNNWDISGMSEDELCLARNEILARHGYTFADEDLLEYFLQFDWYLPNTPAGDASSITYSKTELTNIEFLKDAELAKRNALDLSNLNRTLNYTVSCDSYSITLPAYFKTYATVELDGSIIRIYDALTPNYSYNDGFLFNLHVAPADEESDFYRTSVGSLQDRYGDWYIVYYYEASDERCAPETADLYLKMYQEISRILPTIVGINGCTFYPA